MSDPTEKAIERDFCAGVLTIEEVAEKYGKTVKAIRYWAGKRNLKRAKGARKGRGKSGAKAGQKSGAKTTDNLPSKMPQKSLKKIPEKIAQKIEADVQDETFNPDDFGLNEHQGLFAENVALGKSLVDSYFLAGYKAEGKFAHQAASRLYRNVKVQRAIRWLRDRRQRRLALTEQEIIHQLSSIASADPNLISQIRRVNCRYCWGDNHQYQWRDVDEYERACASALAESKPPPAFDGGVGFVDTTIPNEECPRCNGDGRMDLFFADTSMLDGPERWLVIGVEETMNGLKVKMASPEAARKELLAYLKATRSVTPGPDQPISEKEQLELEGLRLRNERIQAEIKRLNSIGAGEDHTIIHNSMPINKDEPEEPEE